MRWTPAGALLVDQSDLAKRSFDPFPAAAIRIVAICVNGQRLNAILNSQFIVGENPDHALSPSVSLYDQRDDPIEILADEPR